MIGRATPGRHPITWISIVLNIFLCHALLASLTTKPPKPELKITSDVSSSPERQTHRRNEAEFGNPSWLNLNKDGSLQMDLTKLPIPDKIPEDSADSFIVDIGTYIPLTNTPNVHHVLRRPQLPCRHETRILFGLKTEPSKRGRVRRAAIRETWGNIAHYSHYPAQVVFLLGITAENQLEHQLEDNDDLLVGDFVDTFHNLTYKDSLFFTWMKHECPSATYAFKGDDDIFVNPFELEKLVLRENERQGRNLLDNW